MRRHDPPPSEWLSADLGAATENSTVVLDALVLFTLAFLLDQRLERRHFEQRGRPEAREYASFKEIKSFRDLKGPFSLNRATRLGARACVLVGLLYGSLGALLLGL